MITAEQAKQRADGLIKRGRTILETTTKIDSTNAEFYGICIALVSAAKSLVGYVYSDTRSEYATAISGTTLFGSKGQDDGNRLKLTVLVQALQDMKDEIELGMLTSVVSHVQAELFDDFIDYATLFLTAGRKDQAGVIAGVVFEDTLRKLCVRHSVVEKGVSLDNLISTLTRKKVLSDLEAKRARVGAHVRTKATHAQWSEFDDGAVRELIEFLRANLILKLTV